MDTINDEITIRPLDDRPFYGQPDSLYIRIIYVPAMEGYKFEVRNELFLDGSPNDFVEGASLLGTLARGMIDVTINNPQMVYSMGSAAQERDYVNFQEDLTDEEKLLLNNPKGRA